MGLIARMFVRTAAEPSAVAAAVLDDEQIVSAGATVASDLMVRPVMVWRCADWVVVEDLVVSTMAASASTLGEVVTVECFEDAGFIRRIVDGEDVAALFVGDGRPPGVGRLNGAALPAFVDGLIGDDDVAQLRSLLRRSRDRTAESVCDDLVGLFGQSFLGDPVEPFVINVASALPADPPEVLVTNRLGGSIRGVAGDRAGSQMGVAGFENPGDPLDRVVIELGGSALDTELLNVDTVIYVVRTPDQPPVHADIDGRSLELDLAQFEHEPDYPLTRAIELGIEGTFASAGLGVLTLTVRDVPGEHSLSFEIDVEALPLEMAPNRRARFPDRWGRRTAAQRVLNGAELLVMTADCSADVDGDWMERIFGAWVELLDVDPDAKLDVWGVPGVRTIRRSLIGGNGRTWERLRTALDADHQLRVRREIPGGSVDFIRDRTNERDRSEERLRLRLSVPDTGEDTYRRLASAADDAAARHQIRQCSILRMGARATTESMYRYYNTAIGYNPLEPGPDEYLAEPGRLVFITTEVAQQLVTPPDVEIAVERVGDLTRVELQGWQPLREVERIYASVLRPPPAAEEAPQGTAQWANPIAT